MQRSKCQTVCYWSKQSLQMHLYKEIFGEKIDMTAIVDPGPKYYKIRRQPAKIRTIYIIQDQTSYKLFHQHKKCIFLISSISYHLLGCQLEVKCPHKALLEKIMDNKNIACATSCIILFQILQRDFRTYVRTKISYISRCFRCSL